MRTTRAARTCYHRRRRRRRRASDRPSRSVRRPCSVSRVCCSSSCACPVLAPLTRRRVLKIKKNKNFYRVNDGTCFLVFFFFFFFSKTHTLWTRVRRHAFADRCDPCYSYITIRDNFYQTPCAPLSRDKTRRVVKQ